MADTHTVFFDEKWLRQLQKKLKKKIELDFFSRAGRRMMSHIWYGPLVGKVAHAWFILRALHQMKNIAAISMLFKKFVLPPYKSK